MSRKRKRYAKRTKILKYVKVGDTWRFANVLERKGKIVRDHVLSLDREEHHPEGTYYLEWYELDNRRHRKAVENFADVVDEARRKSIEVDAMRAGVIAAPAAPATPVRARLRVANAIDEYLDFIQHHRSERRYLSYRYTLNTLLRKCCGTRYVEDISRDDILEFITDCYKHGLSGRTVYDKPVVVLQMFKRYGKANFCSRVTGPIMSTRFARSTPPWRSRPCCSIPSQVRRSFSSSWSAPDSAIRRRSMSLFATSIWRTLWFSVHFRTLSSNPDTRSYTSTIDASERLRFTG